MARSDAKQAERRPEAREGAGAVGGQGMGQGRGMNAGEIHDKPKGGGQTKPKPKAR